MTRLALLSFLVLAAALPAAASDTKPAAPKSMSLDEARARHCAMGHVTSAAREACVLVVRDEAAERARLVVYDRTADGRLSAVETLSWPSDGADVPRVSFLRAPWLDGRAFVVVEFDGNRGTGAQQTLAALFSWRDGHLALAWLDTRSYHLGDESSWTYGAEWLVQPTGLRIEHWLTGSTEAREPGCDHSYAWTEELRWNAANGRFVPLEPMPPAGDGPVATMRRRLAVVRSRLASLRAQDLAAWDAAKSGVMEVLPSVELLDADATWSLEAVAGGKLESPLMPPEVEEAECHRSTKTAHPDPEPLVREFLQRAGRGEFLEGGAWFDEAVSCPGIEPGPDAFTVVAEARLREVLACGDIAVARVDYDVLGRAEGGTRFVPGRVTEQSVFQLRRTAQGWRIESAAIGLGQHVLAAWLLDAQRLSPRDRREVRSMLAPTGASRP